MKLLTRSVVPMMVALAALIAFFPRSSPKIAIQVTNFKFSTTGLIVKVGDSVVVQNRGKSTHTLTCKDCGVDTGNVQPSQDAKIRFFKPGTFTFVCIYHQAEGMTGRVLVLAEGEPAPSKFPTPARPPASPPPTGLNF